VTLRGSTDVVVRDISNLSKPASLCAFKACSQFCDSYGPDNMRFVTRSRLSYIVRSADGYGAMYLADLSSHTTLLIRIWGPYEDFFWIYAWSPDGNTLTYFSTTEWRIRSAAGDFAVGLVGPSLGYGSNPNADNEMVGFSADGQYVAADQGRLSGALFKVLRVSDRQLVYSRTDGSMATWAGIGANLYFRVSAGLEEWTPINGARLIVSGLGWTNPVASADGKRVAYLSASALGNHYARLVRLTDQPMRAVALSNQPRGGITFLKPTLVWYAGEMLCGPHQSCGCDDASCGPPPTDRTYVQDLVTGIISPSIVTGVADFWPHVRGQ